VGIEKQDPWHSELEDSIYKKPDKLTRQCCLSIVLGDLHSLRVDVHRLMFHGSYEMKVEYCFYCGKPLKRYREVVFEQLGAMLEQQMSHGDEPA